MNATTANPIITALTRKQLWALELIARGGVKRFSRPQCVIFVGNLDGAIDANTFGTLYRNGWVSMNTYRTMAQGQPIELTDAGRALLSA
ncbi:hypothetical protein ABTX34_17120 [Streptomyces sp. NPDC096538]|uniref:hypothetical protein n=1 Tax=Streptomyces sp. NPDC096538 TaxID=3155427 RepID=UPI0033236053